MMLTAIEQKVLAALDEDRLVETFRVLLRIPDITGQETEAQHWLGKQMLELGLDVDMWTIDVAELQHHAAFPGMEVDRSQHEAVGLVGPGKAVVVLAGG
ncbi:hypothetical protein [Dictyobacter kobayashii]|uniref:Peptidase M20 dimerisation domain-containing protein n=1 Tax=Dictyobacter kobayashii TaxID=2014872 RepID=A0A402AXJ3_9CHLR|nr:hypothetical protein [Dictyobacter kobayashii]GCE23860.1 hypothetical protein KDK_76600 [Dictyobacter kobayashii]